MRETVPATVPPRARSGAELTVRVHFVLHMDESTAPRKLQVSCSADATVQDLIEILADKYGEGLREILRDPNLMAILNGISHGKRFRDLKLSPAGETEIEVSFMRFMDHGG